jgi:transposase
MPRWSQQDKFRIAERRKTVASLYLQGKFQHEIAKEVKVDRGTVSRDLTAIEAEWLKSGVMDLNAAKARALAKIDEIEREAWNAFKQSRQDGETMEVTGTTQGGKGKPEKVKKVTHRQHGDSRFLALILDCVKQRCEILGLDAPKKLEHGGIDGGPIQIQLNDEQLYERAQEILNGRPAPGTPGASSSAALP